MLIPRHATGPTRGRQSGLTLASLLIGMGLGTLVLAGASSLYLLSVRGVAENIRQSRLNQELRATLEIMRQDIRRAGYWAMPTDANPRANPFQTFGGALHTAARIGAVTGEASASCLTYAYDLNSNGRVGLCQGCAQSGPPFDDPGFDQSNVELFGFRMRNGGIQMRTRFASTSETTFDCESGHWERITSDEVAIEALGFSLISRSFNLSPDKTPNDACLTGDLCQEIRTIEITLAGQARGAPDMRQRLTTRIALHNDRHAIH